MCILTSAELIYYVIHLITWTKRQNKAKTVKIAFTICQNLFSTTSQRPGLNMGPLPPPPPTNSKFSGTPTYCVNKISTKRPVKRFRHVNILVIWPLTWRFPRVKKKQEIFIIVQQHNCSTIPIFIISKG